MIALWDLGNVLVQWEPELIYPAFNVSAVHTQYLRSELLEHPDWLRLDQGLTTEQEVAARISSETELSHDDAQRCFDVIRHSLVNIDASVAMLSQMKAAGVPMYVLSNMSNENAAYLRTREYFSLFDDVVISAEEKLIKPDPALFELVLKRYRLNAEEVYFIDDSMPNIVAARELGMQALHFKRSDDCYRQIREAFKL
jgi:HAD superfamily hydrolase (TIGR01509 family)